MTPNFTLSNSLITLRLITLDEAKSLQRLIQQSPSLHHWFDWCHPQYTLEEARQFIAATRLSWIRGEAYGFAISPRNSHTIMGMVAINEFYPNFNMASIGYWLGDKFQHHGIAQQAVITLCRFCFQQLELTRLEIVCDEHNTQSQRFIEKCGAQQEAIARNRYLYAGQPRTGLVYSLIPSDLDTD